MARWLLRPVYRILVFDLLVFGSAGALFAVLPDPLAGTLTGLHPFLLSLLCVALSVQIYRSLEKGKRARLLWGLPVLAFGGWALGEALWLFSDLSGIYSLPYPSWADLFYLLGNAFLAAFFLFQVWLFRTALRGRRGSLLIGVLLFLLALGSGAFILRVMDESPSDLLALAASVAYETLYILLAGGASALTLIVYRGALGLSWVLFVSGMWLIILSDPLFVYAQRQGLYYPDGKTTLISISYDLLYIIAYLLAFNGLYLRWITSSLDHQIEKAPGSPAKGPLWKIWVLLSDGTGRAFFVDSRLTTSLGRGSVGALTGEDIGEILGLPSKQVSRMILEARTQGFSQPHPLPLAGNLYALQALTEKAESSEVYWLLTPWQSRLEMRPGARLPLERLLAYAVRSTAETLSSADLAWEYVYALWYRLVALGTRFGGEDIARQFVDRYTPALEACQKALEQGHQPEPSHRRLLQEAVDYILLVAPPETVRETVGRLEEELGEEVVRAAESAGVRIRL